MIKLLKKHAKVTYSYDSYSEFERHKVFLEINNWELKKVKKKVKPDLIEIIKATYIQ